MSAMSRESAARELVVGALGDYDDFNLLPRSSARHLGLIPRRGGLLLPHTAGEAVAEPGLVVLTGWLLATERAIWSQKTWRWQRRPRSSR